MSSLNCRWPSWEASKKGRKIALLNQELLEAGQTSKGCSTLGTGWHPPGKPPKVMEHLHMRVTDRLEALTPKDLGWGGQIVPALI